MILKVLASVFAVLMLIGVLFAVFNTYLITDTPSIEIVLINEYNYDAQKLCELKNMQYITYDVLKNEAVCFTVSPAKHYRYSL